MGYPEATEEGIAAPPKLGVSRAMYFDQFKQQLPDIDPAETQEWLDALDQIHGQEGDERARFVLFKLLKRARQLHVGLPP